MKLYDGSKPIDNYDPSVKEYDAIFIGGGAGGRFGSSYLRAMGGEQLTIDKDNHLGGKCTKNACVIHHYLFDIAVELDFARLFNDKKWYPKIPISNGKVEMVPMIKDFLEGRNHAYDIMYYQSKHQLGLKFILNRKAEIIDKNTVEVEGKIFKTKNLVVGTGSRAAIPNVPGRDLNGVYTYESFLDLDYEPNNVVVVGASKTGIPWASFFNAVGCNTTLVEMTPILSAFNLDEDVKEYVIEGMKFRGMRIMDNTMLMSINGNGHVESVTVRGKDGREETIKADMVFLGTGCIPNSEITKPLDIQIGNRNEIVVAKTMRTTASGVYAIGDVTGGPMEMWKARKAGMVAAKNILGTHAELDTEFFPDFLHTTYEITWIGMTEKEAKEKLEKVFVIRMPVKDFPGLCPIPLAERSMLLSHIRTGLNGFQKVIYDAKTRKLIGAQHVGYGAKDSFQYLEYLIRNGATIDDMANLNELFLNPTHFIQLSRLRAGMKSLEDLS
jgi:pyruvate/2-oxoglutarate dehydrogenase complex dihydrolipoamide dehydrogenase (E3) component